MNIPSYAHSEDIFKAKKSKNKSFRIGTFLIGFTDLVNYAKRSSETEIHDFYCAVNHCLLF